MKISFKLQESTHKTVSMITKYLCYIGYIGILINLSYMSVSSYIEAATILSNHKTVEATLAFTGITEKQKKMRTIETYHFAYSFVIDGKEYTEQFSTSEGNSAEFMNKDTVIVAYSVTDPSRHGRLSWLEHNHSLFDIVKQIAFAAAIMAFVIWILYLYITASLFVVKKNEESAMQAA